MELKQYQQRCLDVLKRYFRMCGETCDAAASYTAIAGEFFTGSPAYRELSGSKWLSGIPYVCLRVPTGGGKTLLACHSISVAMREYKRRDETLVLWLVPSNAILEQTYKTLTNPQHPYSHALSQTLGHFCVKTVEEALYLSRGDVDTQTCIIVSTLQAFRRDDKDGLRVYRQNGRLQPFFNTSEQQLLKNELEKDEASGDVACTLANVIAMRHPIVIVDEAHNARTPLTFNVLDGFCPSCILEFTATPDTKANPSNVLYSVSAQELKAENMIKMPILVEAQADGDWRVLLQRAIDCRYGLEAAAMKERQDSGDYIRPIMLLQAQRKLAGKDTFHAERLKELLINDFKIPEEQVKIATGTIRGLDGVDLMSADCEVRYVITQQALKEGWDCPFAYVLCSLADTSSQIEVEQILGRVLRMPYARRRNTDGLNQAYAFATASFETIAAKLKDSLTQNGFQKFEAQQMVRQITSDDTKGDFPLFDAMGLKLEDDGDQKDVVPVIEFHLAKPLEEGTVSDSLARKLEIHGEEGKAVFTGGMTLRDKEELEKLFPEKKADIQRVYVQTEKHVHILLSPSERGEKLLVPWLMVRHGDKMERFDETALLDHPMDVPNLDASLPKYRPQDAVIQQGRIDTEADSITTEVITRIRNIQEEARLFDYDATHDWTEADLAAWLDRHIEHDDIPAAAATAYFVKVIRLLQSERHFSLETLVLDRFHLAARLRDRLDEYRDQCRMTAYQQLLALPADNGETLCVTPDKSFEYKDSYPCQQEYKGGYKFKKHFHKIIGAFDGKEGGEEELCAQHIDQLEDVKYWVRNLDQRRHESFWLQLHNRLFYPDFVCELKDGRILVVEHKGEDRYTNDDSKEKRDVGEIWAARSHGHCLFVMTCGKNYEIIEETIIKGSKRIE